MEKYNISELLDKYFEGETTIPEEKQLKSYFNSGNISPEHIAFKDLFSYFTVAQTEILEDEIADRIINDTKRTRLRMIRYRAMSIAAIFVILIAAVFIMNSEIKQTNNSTLVSAEVETPEEALEATMEALAYLGVKFNKGAEPISNVKALDKTRIFK